VSVNNVFAASDGSIYAVTYKMDGAVNGECKSYFCSAFVTFCHIVCLLVLCLLSAGVNILCMNTCFSSTS